jgi:hypothetical protein
LGATEQPASLTQWPLLLICGSHVDLRAVGTLIGALSLPGHASTERVGFFKPFVSFPEEALLFLLAYMLPRSAIRRPNKN